MCWRRCFQEYEAKGSCFGKNGTSQGCPFGSRRFYMAAYFLTEEEESVTIIDIQSKKEQHQCHQQ